ncbi:MAG: hypothetical protein UX73_C0021G0004 [candidate division WWE3 bacterium GW2011_GWC1_47_10]|uniref:Glycosyltransferase 2-like domain-containing protein n=1 Tax=candidate division WWE3 bacterium GW2011_GWC1_47_10 TaxID=1619122 RepID=A0A0G1TYQ9_UNCKA|nr:MAG: hypothetical protein UX73_C0021G0004 [candidate division WWE3 bacterium GW2011_GWC1_47_10]
MMASLVAKNDVFVNRILEIVPGALTWLLLLSPVWLGLLYPPVVVYIITFMTVYWFYLAFKHEIGIAIGYSRYKRELGMDWNQKCKELDFAMLPDPTTLPTALADIRHFVLVPVVNESHEILKQSIASIIEQAFPTKQVLLIYTIEEKCAQQVKQHLDDLLKDKIDLFDDVLFFVHPAGIPGEAVGVGGANRTWGAGHAVEQLKNAGKDKDVKNYIFSSLDADHVIHPQYLARLTHIYLTSNKRYNRFYTTAVHLFNNNHWQVPAMMRIEADSVTLGGLSDWVMGRPATKDTLAAYSCALQTLIDANYWDVKVGIDDSVFYWRAFFARDGDFVGTAHYIPYSADAVEGATYIRSYTSLYRQLLRWGWGAITIPMSIKGFMVNGKVPFFKKLAWTLKHFERFVLLINVVFLITFGFSLVTLVNPYVKQTIFAYSLPNVMSAVMTITLIFLIPATIYRARIAAPVPKHWPFWRKLLAFLEGPMVILNLLTFSFFPFVEAQTRMMLGVKMKDLYYTPKVRK